MIALMSGMPIAQIARLLDELAMPGLKAEVGPGCCVLASAFAVTALRELGVHADVVPVSVLIFPTLHAEEVDAPRSADPASEEIQRTFPVFGLGAFNDLAEPVPGGTKLVGFHTAAHAVAVTAGPAVLMDFTV